MTLLERELVRPDAELKAVGEARYTQDLYPPGVLYGVAVRCPHPAARIRVIDVAAAVASPGCRAVLTADDLPDGRYGIMTADEPLVARGVARYVGEPVALVAADSLAEARAAASLVRVDYEPAPAVLELEDAIAPGAPEVHAGSGNVIAPGAIRRGDVEAAFASAALVVETAMTSHRAHQAYIEPRVALAELEDGNLSVTTSSQAPFEVRTGLCDLLGLSASAVRVRVPALGGGFGGKLHLGMAPYAAALCLSTRRAVQFVCSREEEMQSPAPRENSIVSISSALDESGRILARRATIYLDSGAYAYDTPALAATAALQANGPYDVAAVEIETASVYTNTVPTGSFRAPTGPQMAYATEAHMEEIAERLAVSSLELRRRNLVRDGSLGPAGQRIEDPGMEACLDRAAAELERWDAERDPAPAGHRSGRGLACAWWNSFPGSSAAVVTINEDATAVIHTGATEIGTGAVSTALVALVAEELGLGLDAVRLASADTDDGLYDFGSQGSRTLYAAGGAALKAAVEIRQRLVDHVARELEAAPDDLVVSDGAVSVRGAPGSSVALVDAVAGLTAAEGPLVASASFQPVPPAHDKGCVRDLPFAVFNEPSFHCHAAEVEVEEATGRIRVARYAAVHDIGPALNPAGVRGQIEGGVVQGIGYALFEEIQTDASGTTMNASLVDYRLPTIADVPDRIEVVVVSDHPGSQGPRGAKGIGEAPIILPAAAIGAAVRDALGAQPLDLPLDAPRIRQLVAERMEESR
jgi:CO/xanthine dehydrogenase Mo-binding subunit